MTSSRKKPVLIVDDTKTNVDMLVGILGQDHRLGVTLNGRDALHFARTQQPGLILLDIVMPEMDGFQVCRALKSDPATRDIPVVFITAVDSPEHRARCFKQGGADYITKPFSPNEVKRKVNTHRIAD